MLNRWHGPTNCGPTNWTHPPHKNEAPGHLQWSPELFMDGLPLPTRGCLLCWWWRAWEVVSNFRLCVEVIFIKQVVTQLVVDDTLFVQLLPWIQNTVHSYHWVQVWLLGPTEALIMNSRPTGWNALCKGVYDLVSDLIPRIIKRSHGVLVIRLDLWSLPLSSAGGKLFVKEARHLRLRGSGWYHVRLSFEKRKTVRRPEEVIEISIANLHDYSHRTS